MARSEVDFNTCQSILEGMIAAHQFVEAEWSIWGFVDEHIEVRINSGFVACVGAEQVKARDSMGAQLGLKGFELVNDFGPIHVVYFSLVRSRRQPVEAVAQPIAGRAGCDLGCCFPRPVPGQNPRSLA